MPIENAIPVENKKPILFHDVSNVEDLKKLLLSGANINEKNHFEETPLLRAVCLEVDIQVIKEFLFQGADVNAKNCFGITPLYCAIARHGDNLDIVRLLLENGADISNRKRYYDRLLDHYIMLDPCLHEANYCAQWKVTSLSGRSRDRNGTLANSCPNGTTICHCLIGVT
ncbi:ankyrin repeat and SOCS box protein 3-like [Argiope bruennichi]|uniref:ankyrin repeat and SOCS box protein 3-like n=1 Tax=Argiope bruennichi TaxID=94029 RepID=UPI002494667E|nr:ankyrin repeat and SOCS box protein 3-like [Argiope bruennichi]